MFPFFEKIDYDVCIYIYFNRLKFYLLSMKILGKYYEREYGNFRIKNFRNYAYEKLENIRKYG